MDDGAWDSIFTNPHELKLAKGRKDGLEAGVKAGYEDGLDLGGSKGVEFGVELGFIRKACRHISRTDLSGIHTARIDGILDLVEAFPRPERIFTAGENQNIDLPNEMQRIRAKFKVLTTLAKMPQFSLKAILAEEHLVSTSVEW